MKTKIILTSLFTIILGITSIGNLAYANNSAGTDKEEQIELKKDMVQSTTRSGFIPFEVTKNSHSINIHYLQDLSNVNIEIINESGEVVYSNNVNPNSGGNLYIDISNWQDGLYTIYFKYNSGNCAEGEFEVE